MRRSMGDHWVYKNLDHCLDRCVPFFLHMDEGTSLRKTAVMVYSAQPIFGQTTATEFSRRFSTETDGSEESVFRLMTEVQAHNQKGTTYKSRFLICMLQRRMYSKKFAFVYDGILNKIAEQCIDLMVNGLEVRQDRWFFICLGLKGDAPALSKAAHYTRSFGNLGKLEGG